MTNNEKLNNLFNILDKLHITYTVMGENLIMVGWTYSIMIHKNTKPWTYDLMKQGEKIFSSNLVEIVRLIQLLKNNSSF